MGAVATEIVFSESFIADLLLFNNLKVRLDDGQRVELLVRAKSKPLSGKLYEDLPEEMMKKHEMGEGVVNQSIILRVPLILDEHSQVIADYSGLRADSLSSIGEYSVIPEDSKIIQKVKELSTVDFSPVGYI